MSTARLLFICLLIVPCTLGWYTKHFKTKSYRKMKKDGTLKNLKNLTYTAHVDWDNLDGGENYVQLKGFSSTKYKIIH